MKPKPVGRPRKLTDPQWDEIGRRAAKGESMASLAKEFGVDRALVSRRVSHGVKIVKTLVTQMVELPISQQREVVAQVEVENERRRIGENTLAGAAHLSHMFRARVQGLDSTASAEDLRDPAAMIQVINAAAPGATTPPPPAQNGATNTSDAKDRLKRMLGL